jgi:serine phosphatase RsbU (regulator of sigma subunit)
MEIVVLTNFQLTYFYLSIRKLQNIVNLGSFAKQVLILSFFLALTLSLISQNSGAVDEYNPVRVKSNLSLALKNASTQPEVSLNYINKSILEADRAKDRSTQIEALCVKTQFYLIQKQTDEALLAANQAYLVSMEYGNEQSKNTAYKFMSKALLAKVLKDESLEFLHKGLSKSNEIGDTISMAWYLSKIPLIELEVGNVGRAMEFALRAKMLSEETADSVGLAKSLRTLGAIHTMIGNYPSARANIERALALFINHSDSIEVAKAYSVSAELQLNEGKLFESENNIKKAISLLSSESQEFYGSISMLGWVYANKNEFQFALTNLSKAAAFQEKTEDKDGLAITYFRLGHLYLKTSKEERAIESFQKSIKIGKITGQVDIVRQAYKGLSLVEGKRKKHIAAFNNLNSYVMLTDSLFNLQKVSEASKLEEQFELSKRENLIKSKEIELQQRQDYILQQRQKQVLLWIVIALFFGIIIFASREYRSKKRANSELGLQKIQLEEQKKIAETKTRNFTDSLNYAKRIQQAILRASLRLSELFPNSFLLFIPREIVSGDFYWLKEKSGKILFAVADCTGHGVPGAFMSIIGTYSLNRVVNEFNINSPDEILNHVNKLFADSLEQHQGAEIFDGMDIALCSYNPKTMELNYAGANMPLHILRKVGLPQASSTIAVKNKTHVLYQIRPNKQAIGSHFEKESYVNHSIKLMEGDVIYLFSDGFSDQFGGDDGKKYRAVEFRNLICNLSDTLICDQKKVLQEKFDTWKGKRPQIDDVTVLGIKV